MIAVDQEFILGKQIQTTRVQVGCQTEMKPGKEESKKSKKHKRIVPTKVKYAGKEILLPFNICTSSITEIKKFGILIFLPIFISNTGHNVFREVYSVSFAYL